VELLTLESRSLAEQMSLFAGADAVVAQHGAALANLVWCRPGTAVVEIEHVRPRPAYFGDLARAMDLRRARIRQDDDHAPVPSETVVAALAALLRRS
jgi:capsular polysaccharide biosynthesis protein